MSIRRQARSAQGASLILRAEAICPARAEVVAARRFPAREEDPPESECLWWYSGFDGIHIAYAITGEAVDYYAARVAEFRAGDFTSTAGIRMSRVELEYRASVSHEARFERDGQVFEDVDVVELQLGWSQYCGPECAMGFHATRWVVFPAEGAPVVLGNEATPYIVS